MDKELSAQKTVKTLSTSDRLFNKNYMLLWQGQLVSRLGTQVYSIVIAIWLKHSLESSGMAGSMIGSFFMLSAIPMVVFSAFGGAVADRFSRKKIIVYGDMLSGIAVVLLSFFLFNAPTGNTPSIIAVFMVAMLLSTIAAFFGPAISASVPDLVPEKQLPAANSMGQLSEKISIFFGQGFGVPLMQIIGLPFLVFINGLTYLLSAISESFITIPQIIPEKVKGFKEYIRVFNSDLREGIGFIWKNSGLKKILFTSILVNFFTMPIIILLVFYVEDYLGAGSQWYGFLLAIYGTGAFVGFSMAGIFKPRGYKRTAVVIAFMLAEPLGYIAMTFVNSPVQAGVLFFLGGIFSGFVMVNITTILQLTTPSDIRGRVFGALTTIAASTAPLGMGLGGFVYDLLNRNIALIYGASGVIMFFLIVVMASSRDFRSFIAYDMEEDEPVGFTWEVRQLNKEDIIKSQKEVYYEKIIQKPRSEL